MTTYALDTAAGGRITYRDKKRWLWLAGLFYPAIALSGIGFFHVTGSEWSFLIPLFTLYGIVSLLDWVFGEDRGNPPEELVPQLEADVYYRWLPILTIPMHFAVLIGIAHFTATTDLSIPAMLALAMTAGLYSGLGINTAHELGHKKTLAERVLARVVLAVPGYGHFCVEHNRGHHRHVATPEDPATSKMGENIYRFALREIPGAFRRGWASERDRLARLGKSPWHWENEVLQSYLLTAILQVGLIAAYGWIMVPFLVVHNFYAWWQLTSANYIEHYGLMRQKLPNGNYEHCQPWHSWNADFIASNLMLYHLERHSDHHAHPTRRYQCLRSFPDLPNLPNGYFGMFIVALIPAWWYRLMDWRLLSLPHIRGDFSKINVLPERRQQLERRYADLSRRLTIHGAAA